MTENRVEKLFDIDQSPSPPASPQPEYQISPLTRHMLGKIGEQVRQFEKGLDQEREALRARWEMDDRLRDDELLPDLEVLNDHILRAGSELAAVGSVLKRLSA